MLDIAPLDMAPLDSENTHSTKKKEHIEKGMLYDGVFRKPVWVEQSSRLEFLSRLHIRISFSLRPIGWEKNIINLTILESYLQLVLKPSCSLAFLL